MSARSWTVRIPAPAAFLSANQRYKRRPSAEIRAWRQAAAIHARAAKLPGLGRARIKATLHFTDRKRRDAHNYMVTVKALIDGLVTDHGLLPDDSDRYLVGVEICGGEPIAKKPYGPAGMIVLTISEVA